MGVRKELFDYHRGAKKVHSFVFRMHTILKFCPSVPEILFLLQSTSIFRYRIVLPVHQSGYPRKLFSLNQESFTASSAIVMTKIESIEATHKLIK